MHILGSPRPLVDPSLLPTSDRGNVRRGCREAGVEL